MAFKKSKYDNSEWRRENISNISEKLKDEGKTCEEFEVMLSNLTLEEIICLKLELSAKLNKGKFYGLNLYQAITPLTKEAVVKFAVNHSRSDVFGGMITGMSMKSFRSIKNHFRKYGVMMYDDDGVFNYTFDAEKTKQKRREAKARRQEALDKKKLES